MENIIQQSIGDFVHEGMKSFGIDVNTKRQLPSVKDGLKPAYRHVIIEELKNGGKFKKSAAIAGMCIATTHPHGDASLKDPISNLVRWGISDGQGNHGKKMLLGQDIDPASMRYTEVKVSDKYIKIFSEYIPYVPFVESELEGTEPEYLPTPIPLCLAFGTLGIGNGVNCRIPAFTVHSMMDALLNDNPKLLKAPFGMSIDMNESELDLLWNTGVGKISYNFEVKSCNLEGTDGLMIIGQPELFKPRMTELEKLADQGKVYIIDQSDKKSTKIFVAREYNIRSINGDDIKRLVTEAANNVRTYRLTVADGDTAYLIPLREWLRKTYDNYITIIESYKADKINKLKFNRLVQSYLHAVVEEWKQSDYAATKSQLATKLNIGEDVVSAILSKSLSSLAKKDTTGVISKIDSDIVSYENINPKQKVLEVINEF
jgi:DNA gyrase/topoisomerase IV subunit A